MLLAWDEVGGSWRVTQLPLPASTDSVASFTTGVVGENDPGFSCWGAGDCAALINYYNSSSGGIDQDGLEVESNGSWSSYVLPEPEGLPWADANFQTLGCQSVGTCTAFGRDSGAPSGLFEADITPGGAPSFNPVALPVGAPTNEPSSQVMLESCPPMGSCSSAGIAPWAATPDNAFGDFAASSTGGAWSASALPSPAAQVDFAGGGMSCPVAGSCLVATLSAPTGSSVSTGLIWDEESGAYALAPVQFPAGEPGSSTSFDSVSCIAAGDCLAGGRYVDTAGKTSGFFELLKNGSWSDFVPPAPPDGASDPANGVGSVGCSTAGTCAAIGAYTQASGDRSLVLYSGGGTSWQAYGETLPDLPSMGGIQPAGVSCTGDGSCAAAGYYGTTTNNQFLPFVFTSGDEISGTVTQADGTPLAGAQLDLTGTDSTTGQVVSLQTTTGQDGSYSFAVDPGSYTVAPVEPGGQTDDRFLDTSCSGSTQPAACQLQIGAGADGTGDFRLDDLVVNSTAITEDAAESLNDGVCDATPNGPDETCTLPAAIQIANADPIGGQTIKFDIPQDPKNTFDGSVPQILAPATTLIVANPTVIDGTSQPGAGRVELSGGVQPDSITYGLVVGSGGGGSTIKGLVINGFQEMIDLRSGGNTITGNWLGTDAAGTMADPSPLGAQSPGIHLPETQVAVRIESSGNTIGGTGPGAGNVLSSGYTQDSSTPNGSLVFYHLSGAGEIDDTTGGNVIQGNSIGVALGSSTPLILPGGPPLLAKGIETAMSLSGAPDTVGGGASGAANVLAGGATVSSAGSVIQGNTITDGGLISAAGGTALEGGVTVDGQVTVGGLTNQPGHGVGNTFSTIDDLSGRQLLISGSGAVVQGNLFRDSGQGAIQDRGSDVTIGGTSKSGAGNLIEDNASPNQGLPLAPFPLESAAGIVILAPDRSNAQTTIEHNDFERNGIAGAVNIVSGHGVTVTQNVMRANAQAISLADGYYYNGQALHSGRLLGSFDGFQPNDLLPWPLLDSAARKGGTDITGKWARPAIGGRGYTLELYAQVSCANDSVTPGQGETYLGSRPIMSLAGTIQMSFDAAPPGEHAVTATVTAPDGSTSEFSPCLTIGHRGKVFNKAGVILMQKKVPVTAPSASAADPRRSATIAKATPSRTHDSLPLLCPPITTSHCKGILTLKTTGKHPVTIVQRGFEMKPGFATVVPFTLPATLFALLKRTPVMAVTARIVAHDGAAHHPIYRMTISRLELVYVSGPTA